MTQYSLIIETGDDGAALAAFKRWLKAGGRAYGVRVKAIADPAAAEAAARARFFAESFPAVAREKNNSLSKDGEL